MLTYHQLRRYFAIKCDFLDIILQLLYNAYNYDVDIFMHINIHVNMNIDMFLDCDMNVIYHYKRLIIKHCVIVIFFLKQ